MSDRRASARAAARSGSAGRGLAAPAIGGCDTAWRPAAWIVGKHVGQASRSRPSLRNRRISPHCLRHTAAMNLLREGGPITVIALWLGHQSVESTMKYLHADPKIKEDAMERTRPADVPPGRYRPAEQVMAFLESL